MQANRKEAEEKASEYEPCWTYQDEAGQPQGPVPLAALKDMLAKYVLHSLTWRVCILCIQAVTYSLGVDPSNTTTVGQKEDASLITVSKPRLHLHEV